MTLRDLYEIAEKNKFLDADIVIRVKDGVHDVERACYMSNYLAMTPRGRMGFNNVLILDFYKKQKDWLALNPNFEIIEMKNQQDRYGDQ